MVKEQVAFLVSETDSSNDNIIFKPQTRIAEIFMQHFAVLFIGGFDLDPRQKEVPALLNFPVSLVLIKNDSSKLTVLTSGPASFPTGNKRQS